MPIARAQLPDMKSQDRSEGGLPVSVAQLREESAEPQVVVEGVRSEPFSSYQAQQQALVRQRAAAQRDTQVDQSMDLIRTSTTH